MGARPSSFAGTRPSIHSATYWSRLATRLSLDEEYTPEMLDRAINRLMNGDVSRTEYGIRVGLRSDLGDDRGAASAYWPERDRGCLCWSKKSRGSCSHELAMHLLMAEGGR